MVKNYLFYKILVVRHNLSRNESHFLPISLTKSSHVININCLIIGLI